MRTDTDGGDGEGTEKIDVRVPAQLLQQIDEAYEERGYTSRSEAIRDALRDWLDPSPTLSPDLLEDLETSRQQREQGQTRSLDDVADDYGVDLDDS